MEKAPISQSTFLLVAFLVLKIVLSFWLVNDVYELHRDEFLHLDQANHLAAGYLSVPPFTAFVSLLIRWLGNSEWVVRLFPALFGAATIFFCWKMVELLDGSLFAKCLVAIACLCSAYLRLNTLYQPNSFDVLAWAAVFYSLMRYFKDGQPANLYALAVWAALGFLNQYNIIFLLLGLLPALLVTTRRKLFTHKHFYGALLLMIVLVSPNVIWQIVNHFPVLKHMKELQETQLTHVNRADFFKEQLLYFACAIFVLLGGFIGLLLHRPWREHRWVLFTYVATIALFSFFNAKGYYALGLYPVILAFGSAYLSLKLKRWPFRALLLAFTIGTFIWLIPFIMPVYSPVQIIAEHNRFQRLGLLRWNDGQEHDLPQDYADMTGWRELAAIVDSAYNLVPDKSGLLILCDNYGEAGAINYYSAFGNIGATSFSADYKYWMDLTVPVRTKIRVREFYSREAATKDSLDYRSMRRIGEVRNPYSLERGTAVYLLHDPKVDVNAELRKYLSE